MMVAPYAPVIRVVLAALSFGAATIGYTAEHVVEIREQKFQPDTLRIKTGDTVRWANQEKRTSHSVLFKGNPSLESERLFPGETWSRRFDASGTFPYTCGPHPEMLGAIEVVD